ncbi:MAG: NTP transferase domain-containing protein [Chloroflexi bacterium]|nr:NTP transferase domain-containing protein [Chloroflexota bacterium]
MPKSHASEIDVLILCGGLGNRLKEVVRDRPKPMAKINSRPFLDILVDYVASYGFKRFILCIGHMGGVIRQHFKNKNDGLTYVFSEEDNPLGTGGAVKNAEPLIHSNPFMVMNGDSFCEVDLTRFLEFQTTNESFVSMVVIDAKDANDYGSITLGDSREITAFNEKDSAGQPQLVNGGIYLFDKDVLQLIPKMTKFSLERDLFPKIVDRDFYGYLADGTFVDIGTPERYRQANDILCDKARSKADKV